MMSKAVLALLLLVSVVSAGNVYASPGLQYSNLGNGYNYPSSSNSLQYGNLPTSYTPNLPLSYVPTNGVSSATAQYGSYGGSSVPSSSAPVYVPAPLSGSASAATSSFSSSSSAASSAYASSSSGYYQGSYEVPSNYAVLTQGYDSGSSSSGSINLPTTTSSSYSTSGSISNGAIISSPTYSPYTTLGQISGVQPNAQVVTTSTASQVSSSQSNLIQGIPSSPNPIKYEVTTIAK